MGEHETGEHGGPAALSRERLTFHFIKSSYFRVILADGVYGGVSPRGYLRMVFFNERAPLPTVTVQEITSTGRLGEEIIEERVIKDGIVREVETEVAMSLNTAMVFHDWLGKQIKDLKEAAAVHATAATSAVGAPRAVTAEKSDGSQ